MVIHRLLHNSSTINPQVTWGNSENTEFRSFPASKALRSARSAPSRSAGPPGCPRPRATRPQVPPLRPGRLPHQPGPRAHAERPASRQVPRFRHPAIMTSATACAPRYFRREPVNTIARCCATTYHRDMTTWQTPKRAGYMNPTSQPGAALKPGAALIGGVVAV